MQQIIRYPNMALLGGAFCLILATSQVLALNADKANEASVLKMSNLSKNKDLLSASPASGEYERHPPQQQPSKHLQLIENVAALAQQMTQAAFNVDRQGRSATNNNQIDGGKYRSESEKKQVMEFFTPKNLFKNIINLILGNSDEHGRTSRHILDILSKALEVLKNSFSQKARSAAGRGLKDTMEDVASAGVSMLQGYVKSLRAGNEECSQRYLCEASKDAARDGRPISGVVTQFGGYASSYFLENNVSSNKIYLATQRGRNQEDCAKLYQCQENHL